MVEKLRSLPATPRPLGNLSYQTPSMACLSQVLVKVRSKNVEFLRIFQSPSASILLVRKPLNNLESRASISLPMLVALGIMLSNLVMNYNRFK